MKQAFLPPEMHSWASTVALVVSNLLPMAGVLFFGWNVFIILLLYWVESIVIGIFNVVRMLKVVSANPRKRKAGCQSLYPIAFFVVHYGGFCALHGMFVVSFLIEFSLESPQSAILKDLSTLFQMFPSEMLTALAAAIGITISHGISYATNFVRRREYRNITVNTLMGRPYGRILLLHFTIIFGGYVYTLLNHPIGLLVVLVLLKLGIDLIMHWRERKVLAGKADQSPVALRPRQ